MNCSYRSIWNDTTGTFVAVSENATSAGKKTSSSTTASGSGARFGLNVLAVAVMLAFGVEAYALPAGGVVAAGGASISSGAGSTTINQSTSSAAINWQSFNIAVGESVQFVQPSSSSVTLNRVLGADPSSIMGNLTANGKVFLVNPNGVLFGKGASVNVGGLVASTLNVTDADFMAGNYKFSGNSGAALLNQGAINADGGYVALLGANVSNEGVISAKLGTVALAAGNAVTLDVAGDGLLNVTVNEGAMNALVQNGGLIQADGGQVLLTAQSASSLLQSAVNNTGVIQAQTLVTGENGSIMLMGDMQSGTVSIGGTLDVSGMGAGQSGGSVTATGHHVGLFGGHINASGDAGGGTVLVGGDYQGKTVNVQNASATYMSADSTISADATTNGSGGTVVLWSNDSTRAYGSITARGGAQGGDGGLIETSAHWLDVEGIRINASAPNGKPGTWLLDPADVTISLAGNSNEGFVPGAFPAPPGVFTPTAGATASNINSTSLSTLLGGVGGTDITITTTNNGGAAGNITVVDAITWTRVPALGQLATTLTLNAARDVFINAPITATHGNLVVCCGRDITVARLDPFPALRTVTTTFGSVLLSAGRNITIDGAMTTTDGNVAFCAGGDININGAVTQTRGTQVATESLASLGVLQGMTFSAGNAATGPGLAGGGGAVNITPAGGTITITQGGGPTTAAPVTITYNALSYAVPATNFTNRFDAGTPITVKRLVFPEVGDKTIGGSTTAVFTGFLRPDVAGGVRPGGAGGVQFDTVGTGTFASTATSGTTPVTFTGFILASGNAANFALPTPCCGVVTRTTGTINAAPDVVLPTPDVVLPVVPEELNVDENLTSPLVWLPARGELGVVLAPTPPQLLTLAPVETPRAPPPVVREEVPVVVPAPPPPKIYVAPPRPRITERN